MSTRIESTVEKLPEELSKSGVSGEQHVVVTVLDEEEYAKLTELRRLIDEGMNSGEPVDGDVVFDGLLRDLEEKYPELANAPS